MFFFSDASIPPSTIRPDQLEMIGEFRKELETIGVLYFGFSNSIDLKILARPHLLAAIKSVLNKAEISEDETKEQPHVSLSDPLGNWNELLATDPEANFVHLIEVATEDLNTSNQLIAKLGSDT
jgi:hypothetical protein